MTESTFWLVVDRGEYSPFIDTCREDEHSSRGEVKGGEGGVGGEGGRGGRSGRGGRGEGRACDGQEGVSGDLPT